MPTRRARGVFHQPGLQAFLVKNVFAGTLQKGLLGTADLIVQLEFFEADRARLVQDKCRRRRRR